MGIKKFFKIKPPKEDTVEQNRENLMDIGIATKSTTKKPQSKFAAYGQFAKDRATSKIYAPPGYEDFARPPEELEKKEGEEDDLNKSELDEKETKKDKKKKKKKHQQEDEPAAVQDPYARTEKSYRYNPDPYGAGAAGEKAFSSSGVYNEFNNYENGPSYGNEYGRRDRSEDLNAYNGTPGQPMKPVNRATPVLDRRDSAREDPAYGYNNQNRSNPYAGAGVGALAGGAAGGAVGAMGSVVSGSNPYGGASYGSGYGSSATTSAPVSKPISRTNTSASNPYGNASYGSTPGVNDRPAGSNPYAAISGDSYLNGTRSGNISRSGTNPYLRRNASNSVPPQAGYITPDSNNVALAEEENQQNQDELDLNDAPEDANEFVFEDKYMGRESKYAENSAALDELDLNATINDRGEDLNATGYGNMYEQQQQPQWQREEEEYGYGTQDDMNRGYKTFDEIQREEEERQKEEEDQAVDEIKEQIRFTKQSSVASTRNTLKMAQEAEMAGMNTLGMLGHQSEKLNNVERNLDLIKIQNTAADEKVAELKKLNRNILAVHVSNPFNSKRRRREREDMIKGRKMEDKMRAEHMSQELHQSTQRIEGALGGGNETSAVREKYQREKVLAAAKKYQFENDEEDDEMEVEIDRNLDKIQQISGRLKKLALATGEELDSQQRRIRDIEENTDEMDIKTHMNTTRLADIR